MEIRVLSRGDRAPDTGIRIAYLKIDNWNDYRYVTMFYLSFHDDAGDFHDLGNVKIGFKGQETSVPTHQALEGVFQSLPVGYFSLGMEVEYYKKLSDTTRDFRDDLLSSLNDIVFDHANLEVALDEGVLNVSLLRDVSISVIKGQYTRVLGGMPPLSDFRFTYRRPSEDKFGGTELGFSVRSGSKPSTNIHAIIGRNGVGKTTLLNGMIEAITKMGESKGQFVEQSVIQESPIDEYYFSSLVSVSFSAFDPFKPPIDQPDPSSGTCYFYIGLRVTEDGEEEALKDLPALHQEFYESLKSCLSQEGRKTRWERAIRSLETDQNFSAMGMLGLTEFGGDELKEQALALIGRMSSGHAVVLLTITKLVARVEEKTLVLVDEPESHLHPPLLSAFIRSLSELLHDRNGVAIIATHSPVVLQELPKTCVWKIDRSRLEVASVRPEAETFGENVGILTREIFGLEVVNSGFHQLLVESVFEGGTYDQILEEYSHQLGYEAKAILKALVMHRDRDRPE